MQTSELIKSCLRGDSEAEKQLFFRFAPRVLTVCRRYVPQEAAARDLMQDCFVKMFDKLELYDETRGDFGAWLYRLSTNTALSHLRKEKTGIELTFPENLPDREPELTEEDFDTIDNETLLAAIRELPDGYRNILNLYVFSGKKHREIAELLDISEGTSRSQYARAKKLLKSILEKKTMKIYGDYERLV